MGKSLAAVHLIFRFNIQSGFLMVRGGSSKVSVEYYINGIWKSLGLEEGQLLYQSATILRAGACEYELEFTIEEKHKEAYFNERDRFLESNSPNRMAEPPRKMPGEGIVRRERYLEFETQVLGSFGWINRGVDIKTGNLVAIKELRIGNRHSRIGVIAEVDIGRRFLVGIEFIGSFLCKPKYVYTDVSYRLIFIYCSMNKVYFQFWMHLASTVIRRAAVTQRSSISLCHTPNPISPLVFGQAQIFPVRSNCSGLESRLKGYGRYMQWALCTETLDGRTCLFYQSSLLVYPSVTMAKQLKPKHVQLQQLVPYAHWPLKFRLSLQMVLIPTRSMCGHTATRLQKF